MSRWSVLGLVPLLAVWPVLAQEWRYRAESDGVTLSANPLSAAQRTAFYGARGFPAGMVAPYAEACGFSLSLANGGVAGLRFRLAEWSAAGDGQTYRFRPAEDWEAEWSRRAVPTAARIAFRWAQFPADQDFAPGDWIMGMAVLDGRPPGKFRLIARYHDDKGSHDIVLEDLACADD